MTARSPPSSATSVTLVTLDLRQNRLGDPIPWELAALKNLELLGLSSNWLTGPIPWELGYVTNLRFLWLDENYLTGAVPAEVRHLEKLTHLRINGNDLSDRLPEELILLPLEAFWWHGTQLCAPDSDMFQEWLWSIPDYMGGSNCE